MRRRRSHLSRGVAAVEMALILPALLLMVFGLLESGNLFLSWLTVQKSAEMGARFAATGQGEDEGTRLAQIVEQANVLLSTLPSAGSTVSVRSWPGLDTSGPGVTGSAGQPCGVVEVGVSFLYKPITPFIGDVLPETVQLTGSDRKVNEPWKPCP
ncbi:TadE/TadG family type IV pilus assembly protein [Desulfovibrio aminophilus]|uniref:TadE/TadG family type IV pilus assembly protein n=1 Tax=Desulfovibrio aminophilus TaxID=81425 RepID=UPI003397DA7E